jgi:hypothetical protein
MRSGMDRADPAGMAGAPGFEEVERLGAAHLADRNAVGAQAQRGADQIGERGDAILGPHRDKVGRGALQLARVLDETTRSVVFATSASSALVSVVLPVRGAAGDEDVGAGATPERSDVGLIGGHDSGADIVVEREHRDGGLADGEGGSRDHRWQKAFEPFSAFGQLGRDARPEASIRIEHDLDDLRVSQPGRDRYAHRRAQHACAA